ncbi:MAG: efflux RND transporter periplasmic adaptor subunit [Bradyrhizobium sp.]|nr:efflux RND transporter periplasmic adaptor subunit [Bradyrhizobium sp.]
MNDDRLASEGISMRTSHVAIVAVVVLGCVAAGYYFLAARQEQAARPATPPAEVGVIKVQRVDVPLPLTYAGRVAGFRNVEIRAQVSGIILKREFVEGAKVKQGDVLFRIDPRSYQAALDRAAAQLAQTQATLTQTEENYRRIEELSQKQVATEKQLEDARAARDLARAAVQGAQAEIQTAKLNIEFTTVTAPVSGATSLASPPEGSLVQAQQTVLTTITQLDPAYVNFSTSESEFVELRGINRAREKPLTLDDIEVALQFGDRSPFPVKGKLDVSASTVDPRTGTLQIRSIFPNADGALLPNQFVRVLLTGVSLQDVVIVPQQAVSQGPQGAFVYVVNSANDGVMVRPIKLYREVAGGWAVQDELKDGETIVVDGLQRVKPGAPIKPVPFEPVANPSNAAKSKSGEPGSGAAQAAPGNPGRAK